MHEMYIYQFDKHAKIHYISCSIHVTSEIRPQSKFFLIKRTTEMGLEGVFHTEILFTELKNI